MVISQIRKPRLREDQLACSPTAPTGRMGGHRIPESTATTVLSLCFVASQISRNPERVEKPAHAFFSSPAGLCTNRSLCLGHSLHFTVQDSEFR